ncbi:amidase [Acinetobacter sichuanensis]|uniref:amidase n=1 Tax=Acinetobacter sichuanensis TaxID=2136183 RepID=UPI00280C936A|nr:amidase [Acinetobacter sichuanensis]MDQ9021858.1 amidase [Acinetobacter sichuanensis]
MKLSEYADHDAIGLAQVIQNKEVSAEEVQSTALKAIAQLNSKINAVIETWQDETISTRGVLRGVPFLVKDLGLTIAGRKNELGSRIAKGCVATHDSDLMTRFRSAGLNVLGRTTTPEFAASTTTESIFSGATRNPWNIQHGSGGSSGGSGAAVAAGMVLFAHATDGGGSIRVPAAMGGIFGLKPSRGRIPMGPDVDEVWSGLAVHGVLTRTVRDSALLLDIMSGSAVGDPFQIERPASSFLELKKLNPQLLKIAVQTRPLNGKAVHPSIQQALSKNDSNTYITWASS